MTTTTAPPRELIGTAAAASLLGCSKRTVHRLVVAGTLEPAATAPGGPHGAHLFDRDAVEALRGERTTTEVGDDA